MGAEGIREGVVQESDKDGGNEVRWFPACAKAQGRGQLQGIRNATLSGLEDGWQQQADRNWVPGR